MQPKGVIVVPRTASRAAGGPSSGRIDALEHVANRPLVHHVIDALAAAEVKDVVVVVPGEDLREVSRSLDSYDRYPLRLDYAVADPLNDFAHVLASAAPFIGAAACIVHAANGLLGVPLGPLFKRLEDGSPDLVVLVNRGQDGTRRLSEDSKRLFGVADLAPERAALSMTGVCLFGQGALRRAIGASWQGDGGIDLTSAAEKIAAGKGELRIALVEPWHCYAGEARDLLELNRVALDRLETNVESSVSNGNRIEGCVRIGQGALVRSSVIVGPAVIGEDASIADAYIGPYTSVGARARIEGSEVERSIIADGASVLHVGSRLATSVVGRGSKVVREFSLPRALRIQVSDGSEVALS